ncbi:uncharacterized protein N7479_009450, partial [Penicillium vulpinum]|uniref:uncharacterized protein n=1 Tax=Penicillium vulpinum TaxID=29845 RepID=UPI0025482785
WFDIGIRDDSRIAVSKYSRLQEIASELANPQSQYPLVCAFLGRKNKDYALQQLFPRNNIKRYNSDESHPNVEEALAYGLPCLARLVFLFTDIIYIFAEDFSGLDKIVEFLECCVRLQSVSPLPHDIRPQIILVF